MNGTVSSSQLLPFNIPQGPDAQPPLPTQIHAYTLKRSLQKPLEAAHTLAANF